MNHDSLGELAESYYGKPKTQSGVFLIVCAITVAVAFAATFIPGDVGAQTRYGASPPRVTRRDPTAHEMAVAIRSLEGKVRKLERRVRTLER